MSINRLLSKILFMDKKLFLKCGKLCPGCRLPKIVIEDSKNYSLKIKKLIKCGMSQAEEDKYFFPHLIKTKK